jgi:ATP-dependent Clp protease ATP-binding subunit ClpB
VHITDQALITAAKLAERYIRATGRHNPDAAIDLLDEACASVRVSLDSQPEVLDKLNRKKTRLEIELESIKREQEAFKNKEMNARVEQIQKELSQVENEMAPLEQ